MRKALKYALTLTVAAGLLYLALREVEWKAFLNSLRGTRWLLVAAAQGAGVLALVLRTLRWRSLIRPFDGEVSFRTVWDAINVGNLFNLVIPGSGELVRGRKVCCAANYPKSLGSIAMERSWDILFILVLALAAVLFNAADILPFIRRTVLQPLAGEKTAAFITLGALIGLLAAFAALAKSGKGKISKIIADIFRGFASFGSVKGKGLFILESAGVWTMYVLSMYLTILAVPELGFLGIRDAIFLSAIGNFTAVIPVPGGIGAYHYIIALSISSLYGGAGWETGLLVATLGHEAHSILVILLGALSALLPGIWKR